MALPTFDYIRPSDLAAARDAYAEVGEARYLAGGQTLIPVMKQRLAQPTAVIDLGAVADLKGIRVADGEVTVGAMTCHAEVAASRELQALIPALANLAGMIGDPQVRNRGTLGGSLANNDPSADYPAAVLGLGASVHTDRRTIPADAFFDGLFTTSLADGEMITSVTFLVPARAGYVKFRHPASRFALVGVMVSQGPTGVRVAATGAGSGGVFRVTEMEAALAKDFTVAALDGITIPADDMIVDMHATGAYRAHLVAVLARRAVAEALGQKPI
jgi:aerobic carbon-monoxide dehydrogenase medium subunit